MESASGAGGTCPSKAVLAVVALLGLIGVLTAVTRSDGGSKLLGYSTTHVESVDSSGFQLELRSAAAGGDGTT